MDSGAAKMVVGREGFPSTPMAESNGSAVLWGIGGEILSQHGNSGEVAVGSSGEGTGH